MSDAEYLRTFTAAPHASMFDDLERFRAIADRLEYLERCEETLRQYGKRENWVAGDVWIGGGHGYEPAERVLKGGPNADRD